MTRRLACVGALLFSSLTARADDGSRLVAGAEQLMREGRTARAIAMFDRAARTATDADQRIRAWAALGRLRQGNAEPDKAQKAWSAAADEARAHRPESTEGLQAAAEATFVVAEYGLLALRRERLDTDTRRGQKRIVGLAGTSPAWTRELARVASQAEKLRSRYRAALGFDPQRADPVEARLGAVDERLSEIIEAAPCPKDVSETSGPEGCSEYRLAALEFARPLHRSALLRLEKATAAPVSEREHYAVTEARAALCRLDPARCPVSPEPSPESPREPAR